MAEYIERCVDCIHYAACEKWAKIAFGDDTMFPYEGECEHEHICPDYKPAANMQEVRRGRWLYVSGEGRYAEYECSECKKHVCFDKKIDGTIPQYKGCPHCLAKMDGKGET